MSTCKYIAAGFTDDVEKLFNDFAQCHSNDFKTFCAVWKEHKFGYIFMGRPDNKELREFTGEIYQLTLNYMSSSSFDSQIAAIYLLYALYRNQDVISPVKIRISKLQYHVIQDIHAYAVKGKEHSLYYIIEFLKKNCFELVANCTVYGPCCSLNKENPMKSKADQFGILSDLKQDLTFFHENNIPNLKKMRSQYLEQKSSIMSASAASMDNGSQVIEDYEKKIRDLREVLGKNRDCSGYAAKDNSDHAVENNYSSSRPIVQSGDIGRRRLELKAAASESKVIYSKMRYHEEENDQKPNNNEEGEPEKVFLKKKRNYNKRIPVNKRRIGRPRKYEEKRVASDECESDDSDFKYSFQIQTKPVKKGPVGRRKASYLRNYEGPIILTPQQKPVTEYSEISDESFDDQLEF